MVTNVEANAQSLGELYLCRYRIEFDIRDLKVTMDTENILARKLDTAKKELLGSVIAYNLVPVSTTSSETGQCRTTPIEF